MVDQTVLAIGQRERKGIQAGALRAFTAPFERKFAMRGTKITCSPLRSSPIAEGRLGAAI